MNRYAQIVNGLVYFVFTGDSNPYEGTTLDIRDVTAVTPAPQQGWRVTETGEYLAPPTVVVPPVPPATRMSRLAFQSRYTLAEQVGIEAAASGAAGTLTAQQRATLRVLERALATATDIDLADPRTVQGVQLHAQMGLITPQRAAQILDPAWSPTP